MRFACGYFAEGGFASGLRHDYESAPRRVTQFFKDFSGRDSVPGSDATHLIADQTGGRNSLAAPAQKGRTITKITMPIMSSLNALNEHAEEIGAAVAAGDATAG